MPHLKLSILRSSDNVLNFYVFFVDIELNRLPFFVYKERSPLYQELYVLPQ